MSLGVSTAAMGGHLKWMWPKQGVRSCALHLPFLRISSEKAVETRKFIWVKTQLGEAG